MKHVTFPPTLVTGSSGRLGRMLQDHWRDDRILWTSRRGGAGLHACDPLRDPKAIATLQRKVDVVLCLAGVLPGRGSLDHNSRIATATVRAAAEAGAGTVFLCSSAAVYGNSAEVHSELDVVLPTSPYGSAKLRMEQEAKDAAKTLGVGLCCLRIANVAGADAILGGWRPGFQLDQLPDGTTPVRSYIGPLAFAACLAQLIARAHDLPDIVNIALPTPVAMGDLLDAAGLTWSARPATANTIPRVVLDTTRLSNYVTLAPAEDTAQGIADDWANWREKGTRI